MTPESDMRVEQPAPTRVQPAPVPEQPAPPQRTERFLLPGNAFRLTGEESRDGLVVYLTEAQAAAPARLQLSYVNAVVVAPEASRLSVRVNGTEVTSNPISSSASAAPVAVDLPAGLLRAGPNRIEFAASQRHRTDCSIESTYELWTEIAGSTAMLSFDGADLDRIRELADLRAVGVDAAGDTTIRLITPDLSAPEASLVAVNLAQILALTLRVPNLHVESATALSDAAAPGVLDVVLGPADQLPPSMAPYAAQAGSGAIAAMVSAESGAHTLLVSGPDWARVGQASGAILAAAPVSPSTPRIDLPNANPMLLGGQSLALSDLGVPTVEFNGRRYTALFQFELPPDFYANLYGEAELVLDAAYSADVLPGSQIDIYANDQIASSTPLLRTDGGTLRDTVIRLPMTNLRPGRNELEVAVNLNAQSDEACSPGWTGRSPVRFVFSSSTQFRMPNYARAAELPDLLALTGSAWPYSNDAEVPLVLAQGADSLMTAMTLLARAATSSGKVLPVSIVSEDSLQPEENALFVMPLSQMSPMTADRVGLARGAPAGSPADEGAVLDQFRGGAEETDDARNAAAWMLEKVGLSLEDLRVLPRQDEPYPVAEGSVVVSQALQPEGGLWTAVTGSDPASMLGGMERLAETEQWRQVAGRVSTLEKGESAVTAVVTVEPTVVQTQPFSIWNMRLVAANWFSGNILFFTAVLGGAAVLLMLATALILGRVGRQR